MPSSEAAPCKQAHRGQQEQADYCDSHAGIRDQPACTRYPSLQRPSCDGKPHHGTQAEKSKAWPIWYFSCRGSYKTITSEYLAVNDRKHTGYG